MLRTVGDRETGKIYSLLQSKAIALVEAQLASFTLEPPTVRPLVEAEPDVEVLGKAPRKSPRTRMVSRSTQKGS